MYNIYRSKTHVSITEKIIIKRKNIQIVKTGINVMITKLKV